MQFNRFTLTECLVFILRFHLQIRYFNVMVPKVGGGPHSILFYFSVFFVVPSLGKMII